jgi:hypothetical protein
MDEARPRLLLVVTSLLALVGCAYRLPPSAPPSQQRVRIVAKTPQLYLLRADFGRVTDYQVPDDGRIVLGTPAFFRGCSVYFLDGIKISSGNDPSRTWAIAVISGGKTVRRLSLRQMSSLAVDPEGYHLLSVAE